jgi:L-alanine-DL-glutamate epimerase-like enolase superfamily enzyme
MKIGRDPHEDLDRVMAVRKLVGPSIGIRVDANQKWSPPEVVRRIRLLERADLFWLEEPTLSDDVEGHVRIRQRIDVPIAVGESLYTKHQFADWITRGACDYVQPNVHRVGGVTEFMKIVKLAEGHNVPVSPHFGMELVAHLGCAAPNIIGFEGLRGAGLSEMGIVEEPTVVTDGRIRPSQRPGHGVRFRRDVLEQHALTEADLRADRPVTRIDLH